MSSSFPVLPDECWEMIISFVSDYRQWEALSLVSSRFLYMTNHLRRSFKVSFPPSLPSLLRRFPNLTHVTIRYHQIVFPVSLDSLVTQVADHCPCLETLDISGQGDFPLKGLLHLGVRNKRLKKLDCSYLNYLAENHLFTIGSSFPFLEELSIRHPLDVFKFNQENAEDSSMFPGFVTDTGVIELSRKLNNLRKLDVSGNLFISDKSILSLAENCPLLSELVVCLCDFVSQKGIGSILRSCAQLDTVSVDEIGKPNIDSYFQESFSFARNLRCLNLYQSFISDNMLLALSKARLPLRKLTISRCHDFGFGSLRCLLCSYQDLEHLSLKGTGFLTDHFISELSQFFTKLVRINLSLCSQLTGMTLSTISKNCPLMEIIKMHHTGIGTEAFEAEPAFLNASVRSVYLLGCVNMDDERLKSISLWFSNLRHLDISGCSKVSGNGIREVLRNCCNIRSLEITHCENVRSLSIDFDVQQLETLVAKGTMIDDDVLNVISRRFKGVVVLDLQDAFRVTIEGLKAVTKGCKNLRELNLIRCESVKPEGVIPMILSSSSLRKVALPRFVATNSQKEFLLQHGCMVCPSLHAHPHRS